MFSGSKSFFRNPTGGGVVTPTDASFSSVPLLLQTTSAVTGKSTTVSDAATPSGSFTVNGSPTFGLTSPYQPDGYWSNQFNGSSYLSIARNAALIPTASQNFTFEAWVYLTQTPSSQGFQVFGFQNYGVDSDYIFFINSSLVPSLWINAIAGTVTVGPAITLNSWNHIAIERKSGNTLNVYTNGVAGVSVISATTLVGSSNPFTIGGDNNGDAATLIGYISNARIVIGSTVYGSNFTPPAAPLTAIVNTVLLTCQSNRFKDNSTNNYTITPSGTPSVSAETPLQADGYWSNQFNGSSYLSVASNAALAMGTGDFTVEFWIYPIVIPGAGVYTSIYVLGASLANTMFINFRGSGTIGLTDAGSVYATTASPLVANNWYHIAVVRSSGSSKIYTNGVGGTAVACSIDFAQNFVTIAYDSINTAFNGYLSNLRVIKGVAVYTSNFTPSTTPLTVTQSANVNGNPSATITGTQTSLLTCQSSSFKDNSTNNFTITRNGSPVTKSVVQPFTSSITSNGAALFNGSSSYLQFPAGTAFAPGTGDFTVECWVYVITHNVAQGNWIYSQSASGHNYFVITFGPSGAGFTAASSGAGTGIGNSTTINTNTWYHIAVTRSSGIVRVFVNGVSGTPTSNTTDLSNVSYVPTIGSYSHAVYGLWNGYISNFRYVKGVAVYTGNFTPPSNFLTTTGGTYPSTSNVTTSIASTNTSLLANFNGSTYSGSSTLNTVTRNGTPTTGWISPYQTDGYWGNYFDGSSSLNLATNAIPASGAFTFETFVYPTGTAASQVIAAQYPNGTNAGRTQILWNDTANKFSIYIGSSLSIISDATYSANTWLHLVIQRDASNVWSLYVNGTRNSATVTNAIAIDTAVTYIGNRNTGGGAYTGYISNLRVVTSALYSGSTISVPTTPFSVSTTNQVLLTCYSNRFIDANTVTTAKVITVTGTPQITPYYYPSGFTAPTASLGAGYFNGNGSYLTITNNANLRPGTLDFTLECWVYWSGTNSGNATIFNILGSAWSGYSQTGQWIFYITPATGSLTFQVWNSVGVAAATALVQNRWYHIAVTRSSNTFKLYLNGKLDATNTISLDASTTVWDFYIGAYYDPSGPTYYGYFPGYLSDLRMVLNTVVYTGDFTPPSGRLTQTGGTYPSTTNVNTSIPAPNTRLLLNFTESNYISASTGVNNNTFIDDSNYAYTVTRNGTPTQGSFTPYWPNGQWSNYFNGSSYIRSPGFNFSTSNFSIECFLNTAFLGAGPQFLGGYDSAGQNYTIAMNAGGVLGYFLSSDGSNWDIASNQTMGTVVANRWHHIVIARTGNKIRSYFDGVGGTVITTSAAIYTNTTNFWLGAAGSAGGNLTGYLSNVRVLNGSSAYDANQSTITVPTAPFPTNTTNQVLLTCYSNRFIDANAATTAKTITVYGTPTVQAFQPFSSTASYTTALYGGSGYFNGSPDYLNSPTNTSFALGTNNFTIEMWVYLLTTSGGKISTSIGNFATYDPLIGYLSAGSADFSIRLSSTGSSWNISDGSVLYYTLNLNSWNHIALVRNGSNIALYGNGSLIGSVTSSASIYQSGNYVFVGKGQSAFYFPGYIANYRFVNGTAVYTSAFTPPIAPLKAIPNTSLLLNFTNAAIYDAAVQNNVTTVGDAQASSAITAKWPPTSIKFDPTTGAATDSLTMPLTPATTITSGDFTIEFWLNPSTVASASQAIVGTRENDGAATINWGIFLQSNQLSFQAYSTTGVSMGVLTHQTTLSAGTWYYCALTRNGSTFTLYINSVASTSTLTSALTIVQSGTTLYVGKFAAATTVGALNGYIQDLRITKGVARTITTPTAAFPTR